MTKKILILSGDGVGPEIVAQAEKILSFLNAEASLAIELDYGLIGGSAIDETGVPLPEDTLKMARDADAVLLGAIGGPKWENIKRELRPEKGLLGLRAGLGVFANLRPAIMYPQLAEASTLRAQAVSKLNIMIVRELTGGIYFGEPRGIRTLGNGERQGFNTMTYQESEIERICRVAFDIARARGKKVCSVDKANVLEVSELWREIATKIAADYPDVEFSSMYVDNAAMQLIRYAPDYDVIVTGNLFGDILSDEMAMISGSLGMLPSASLGGSDEGGRNFGLYEPSGGSAPDIAGQGIANPIAQILSLAMLLRYSLAETAAADSIEVAVEKAIGDGFRTGDIFSGAEGEKQVGTAGMGAAIVERL